MGVFEVHNGSKTEYLVIPYLDGLHHLGDKLFQKFSYNTDENESLIKKSENKEQQLQRKYIRDIIRPISNSLAFDKEKIEKSILLKSIDDKEKTFLIDMLKKLNREDYLSVVYQKYSISSNTANYKSADEIWLDSTPISRSNILIARVVKEVMVAFNRYDAAIDFFESEYQPEMHYNAYCSNIAYLRNKADVVRDACDILIKRSVPTGRRYQARPSSDINYKVYQDRISKVYDTLKKDFKSKKMHISSNYI